MESVRRLTRALEIMVLTTARSVAVAALLVAGAWPAHAQIYSWRDAKGTLVLSNTPPPGYKPTREPNRPVARVRAAQSARLEWPDRYEALITKHARTYDVSHHLVRAVMQVESGFNPYAVSPKGAMGLMQLMPATAIQMGVTNPFDPDQNIRGGVAYLRLLLNRYAGDVSLALAAYNAGPAVVDRYNGRVPYAETRNYVSRLTGGSPSTTRQGAAQPKVDQAAAGAAGQEKARVTPPAAARPVYKTIEIIDGRPVTKYTDSRPVGGAYEVVPRR